MSIDDMSGSNIKPESHREQVIGSKRSLSSWVKMKLFGRKGAVNNNKSMAYLEVAIRHTATTISPTDKWNKRVFDIQLQELSTAFKAMVL